MSHDDVESGSTVVVEIFDDGGAPVVNVLSTFCWCAAEPVDDEAPVAA